MFELYTGALNPCELYNKWFYKLKNENCGALLTFCGIVRAENNISGLSFEIYEPILKIWFDNWCQKVAKHDVKLCFAHSIGDVKNHESSYFIAVLSKKRKLGLTLLNNFVEDFKANAPIWKYDLVDNKKIYKLNESQKLPSAGILYEKN